MEKKIQIFLREHHMIKKGEHVVAGVSGGADSVCLLLVLKHLREEMGFALTAVHVEHGIRGEESIRDAEFVKRLCEREQIGLQSFCVDVPGRVRETGQSLEEAARFLRYRCFFEAADLLGADCIALAHQGDDCAETMLFHLSRGTGLRGLCGIVPVREMSMDSFCAGKTGRVRLIRPLLCATRAEVERYLADLGQDYCTDSTNGDVAYARNRIRQKILPEFSELNAQAVRHMVQTAGYLEEIGDFLDEAAWEQGRSGVLCSYEDGRLSEARILTEHFANLHPVLGDNLIHRILGMTAGSRKDITGGHIRSVRGLFDGGVGKSVSLPYGLEAVRTYDAVIVRRAAARGAGEPEEIRLRVPGETCTPGGYRLRARILDFDGNLQKIPGKPYTKWFDYGKMKGDILLRNRRPGDYFQIDAAGGHKKFKDYLIDRKVEREERERILLVAENSHVIWAVGYRISEAYKVSRETKQILEIHICKGEENERDDSYSAD